MSTWVSNGQAVAWAWSRSPGRLDLQVDPVHLALLPEILGRYAESWGGSGCVITVMDAEVELIDALSQWGYRRDDSGPYFAHLRRNLIDPLVVPPVPQGFTLRAVRTPDDAQARAAVHRAAFADYGGEHSLTTDVYKQVMAGHPYLADLDWIVEDTEGTVAAFCLCWVDVENATAVLEPVGTDPRFRRRGLARAAVAASLRAARERGARYARVCARGDSAYTAAAATYEDIGFSRYARNIRLIDDGPRLAAGGA
ncbi:GNAT family N-acetyltransferase [Ruania zhangjianzhongii]|uniref:GNAT family N-acetyltransferase n=1 Tax=Ruania zhangjianzhongii TaxID=2603206 RepID=UPI00143DDB98|nr:GNAT family N-acetyltransferase [Ruania zhangjianzhongii]